ERLPLEACGVVRQKPGGRRRITTNVKSFQRLQGQVGKGFSGQVMPENFRIGLIDGERQARKGTGKGLDLVTQPRAVKKEVLISVSLICLFSHTGGQSPRLLLRVISAVQVIGFALPRQA